MPRKERKTIDYPKPLVDDWKAIYLENKVAINKKGHGGFQDFMTFILNQLYETGNVPDWVLILLGHLPPS